jgi:hypothetical protein
VVVGGLSTHRQTKGDVELARHQLLLQFEALAWVRRHHLRQILLRQVRSAESSSLGAIYLYLTRAIRVGTAAVMATQPRTAAWQNGGGRFLFMTI